MITIKDVAKRAGVASSTVSCVLNGKDNVSELTRQKVLGAASELNYVKHGPASELKRKSTQTIGVMVHDMSSPYFSDLVPGIESAIKSHGYDLIVCSSMGGEKSTANRYIREKRIDGAIVIAQDIPDELLTEAAAREFPIVVMDRELTNEHIVNVLMDDEQGGYLATKYLIDQGHRTIAYINGPFNSDCNLLRYQGFLRALSEADIEEKSEWRLSGQFCKESGYHAAKMLIEKGLPSAVFFANDDMAIGGLEAFREHYISVPEQISVVGFDNIHVSQYVSPPLTTFRQPKTDAGLLAGHLLIQMLNGEQVKSVFTLDIQCVERQSVRAVTME
ncbi:LacI family DNA-binding transcriptional regulator [Paenibacillus illinoisensis]|uniref:LacI family DNA-binding transcriptional regulator n=1 Tax=Paenibacillus illinoisensis TaxID=59845 RepID=UPI001C8E690B|nr:LacI family DNA-binding transcriptional regulator [Paenibacillus illinoisensis]MBY0219128.1 LacI family DNA-binding transcriptional regulator [Paenibacillus illinoisensis]